MEYVKRKVVYKLYPNQGQRVTLDSLFESHRRLYNALLEQRIQAWKMCGKSLSYYDQCQQITLLRNEIPEYKTINAQSLQETASRLHKAYLAFFNRVKKGQTPGFPRFKSKNRFSGWGYKTHGDGWRVCFDHAPKVTSQNKTRGGHLRLSGMGPIAIRGMARNGGVAKTLEIQKKGEDWFASITFLCQPERSAGEHTQSFDWGVEHFLTIADENHAIRTVENPRFFKQAEAKIIKIQQTLSQKAPRSQNRRKLRVRLARIHRTVSRQRTDFIHKQSCRLVSESKKLYTEKLCVKPMTKSPKAKKDPQTGTYLPNGAARKAGLNKSILDTSVSQFLNMVRIKAEEAGYKLQELPTKTLKPSQRCAQCGTVTKKTLSERQHHCAKCGFKAKRDANSALVMLRYGLSFEVPGTGPVWVGAL